MLNKQFYKTKKKNEKEYIKKLYDAMKYFRMNIITPLKYVVDMEMFAEYGRAINYCIKYNLDINKIKIISKNKNAEDIMGLRNNGNKIGFILWMPYELDYFCPLCATQPNLDKGEIELMHIEFSEYRYFMYCKRCNIDIPSLLCLQPKNKKELQEYTNRYIKSVRNIQIREQYEIGSFLLKLEDIFKECIKDINKKRLFRKKNMLELYDLYRKDINLFIDNLPKKDPEKKL